MRFFCWFKQWPGLTVIPFFWRRDVYTLITGSKKPSTSDQTHSSSQSGYQFSVISPKTLEGSFIVTLWQFKAKLSPLLSSWCQQMVVGLTLGNFHESKTLCLWFFQTISFHNWLKKQICQYQIADIVDCPKQRTLQTQSEQNLTISLFQFSSSQDVRETHYSVKWNF